MCGIKRLAATVAVFILIELIVLSEQALVFGDKGVCKGPVANIPSKCPRGRKCPTKFTNTLTCCPGWEYKNGRCVPRCESGCKNGTCIDVDVCQCVPPLVLKEHACVTVTCDPPCVNGACVDDNECKCYPGTTSLNGTHCTLKCPEGYDNGHIGGYFIDPMECQPRCEKTCTNSLCTAPNTCSCIRGYKYLGNDNSTCIPECNPACINGDCVAPGICTCAIGYTGDTHEHHKCNPVCTSCIHGDCIAPDTCKCHEGYSKREGICMPDCDRKCVNGICSEPNICACDNGYQIDPNNKFNCEPTCKNKCVNASCVAPNVCSCLPGYVRENEWSCRPNCSSCENGECISPGNCQCNEGYSKKGNDSCTPDCKNSCIRGQCIAPDECSCFEGYALEKDGFTCNPTCDGGCINSTCVQPNKCDCLDGYELVSRSACKPTCHVCINGDCVAPKQCSCHEGYTMIDSTCSAICRNPCINGVCTTPDHCECKYGYIHNTTEPSICYKPCEGPCHHGKCTEHGECICDTGYELENGTCVMIPIIDCATCSSNCEETCVCEDRPSRPACVSYPVQASSTSMAGLQLTWVMGGAVGFLLLTLVIVVIQRIWTKRQAYENKTPAIDGRYGSVVYTVPDTLMHTRTPEDEDFQDEFYEEVALAANSALPENDLEATCDQLLAKKYDENECVKL